MRRYLAVFEETGTGYSAYSPRLDGCVSTGRTREEVQRNKREAIEFHLDGLRHEGLEVPAPHTYSAYVEVPA
ncbi:MAG TPA: type II toxin-antitoxin system HicB family antitoxin [Terriglobia bacterium]|nr:type II toxin-antitoxin system HicB family antitoxin [Terriglobia bacterium]